MVAQMDEMKDIVHKVFANIVGSSAPKKQEDISRIFDKVLKEQGLAHAKIAGLKEGTLVVNIDSPARLYQFNLKKKKILEEINRAIPDIQKIYFKIGKIQ